jgi:hypothetical protein
MSIKTPPQEQIDLEIGELDLLQGPVNLAATLDAFNNRFQKKKQEKEDLVAQASQIKQLRQAVMLQAMMIIRRSLREVARVNVGDSFSLFLTMDDLNGWPRLELGLRENYAPEREYPSFNIITHDRGERGLLEFQFIRTVPVLNAETIYLSQESDLIKVNSVLKKCVRRFLDVVEEVILNASSSSLICDEDEGELERTELENNAGDADRNTALVHTSDHSGDFFEEGFEEEILDKLPSLGDDDLKPL